MTKLAKAFLIGFLKAAGLSPASTPGATAATPNANSNLLAHPVTRMPGGQMVPRTPTNTPAATNQVTAPATNNVNSWTNHFDAKAFANHAILPAEHNTNYGILTKYQHTTPEQASINTVNHAKRDFMAQGGGDMNAFIKFLGNRYAPVKNATNDPNGLNKNWIPNVTKFWNQYNATNQVR